MKTISKRIITLIIMFLVIFSCGTVYAADNINEENGSIVKLTGDIYVNEGNYVKGDVVTLTGNVYVNGVVAGDVVSVLGNMQVNGKILGDAVTVAGKIEVGSSAKVSGSIVEVLGGKSNLNNYNFNIPNRSKTPKLFSMFSWSKTSNILFSFILTMLLLLISSLVYAIMPDKIEKMSDSIELNLAKRIGFGLLTVFGAPIVMVLISIILAITIIGVIIIPFVWMAYLILMLVGIVPVYVYLGKKVAELIGKQKIAGYAALTSGLLTVWLVKAVTTLGGGYTQWINWVIAFLIFVLGMGTVINFIFTKGNRYKGNGVYQQGQFNAKEGDNQKPNASSAVVVQETNSGNDENAKQENK